MFFDINYIRGDNSVEGFLDNAQSLEERTNNEVSGVESILNLPNGSKILDLPCGYGRHSIELAFRGFDVSGVDINPLFLSETAARFQDRDDREYHMLSRMERMAGYSSPELATAVLQVVEPKLRLAKVDMRQIDFQEEFDAVINMFYSFGFFSDEDNAVVLDNFYKALKKGGQFVLHTDVSPEMMETGAYPDLGHTTRTVKPTMIHHLGKEFPKATLHIDESYDPESKRIIGSWTMEEQDGSKSKKDYSVRIYSAPEFVALCKNSGFGEVKVYGGWDKKEFDGNQQEMIIHAIK
jgi:SAM-dependent methyltransferase